MSKDQMDSFFQKNLFSIISLAISLATICIHVGMTKAKFESTVTAFGEFKKETKEKIRDIEDKAANQNEKVNEKLDSLNQKMAAVVSWVEEQKRYPRTPQRNE